MKRILFTICLMGLSIISFAQTKQSSFPGQSQFYVEGGGPGVMFSANYDRRFSKSRLGWGMRGGLGFITYDGNSYSSGSGWTYSQSTAISVPLQVNYVFGKANSPHTFEAGAGFTALSKALDIFDYSNSKKSSVFGTASFMYRRAPVDGGFTWRAGFTPLFGNGFVQPFGSLGIGYSF